jgi:hypothetical protein
MQFDLATKNALRERGDDETRPPIIEHHAEAFAAYARANSGAPDVSRYQAIVGELRRAAGTWGNPALFAFMESEARAQRVVLLDTLSGVREAWSPGWCLTPDHIA